jgi:phenylacetate-CoA ligase
LHDLNGPLRSLDELAELPFTFKDELLGSADPGHLAANLTFPLDRYTRFHQTSGTRGRPLVVLDTPDDWSWWIDCWQFVLDAAGIESGDRALLAFSFGPFIGFWSAFDAACARGCLVVPGGGLTTLARLELVRSIAAGVVFCTPSYALHMAEVGGEHQIDVGELGVRILVLAGEPGGSVPAIRGRIETLWRARVLDHAGATEIGPWGYGDVDGKGLFVNENDFIAEFLAVETGTAAAEGELSELVLTTLGRVGSPVVRYRTGDLVRPSWQHGGANRFVFLPGGVLSRADDMMVIRGVNVFPSSVEQILRSFPELIEYRMTVRKLGEMDHLVVEIEDRLNDPLRVATELQLRLGLKVEVRVVALGSLPRVEGKGKRFVDERCTPTNR